VNAIALLEDEHAKAAESGIVQSIAVLGFIHAEAAWAAGAGGEEDVSLCDLFFGQAAFPQLLQVAHQTADGEIGWVALAVVAVLFAGLEVGAAGHGETAATVAGTLKDGQDQLFMLPGKSADEDGNGVTLGQCERQLFWPAVVLDWRNGL
jgi:hypothetical protein